MVYGRPALALPLAGICAHAEVANAPAGSGIVVHARDMRRHWRVAHDPHGPISALINATLAYLDTQLTPSPPHPLTPSPLPPPDHRPPAGVAAACPPTSAGSTRTSSATRG